VSPLTISPFNETGLMNGNYFIEIKTFGPVTNALLYKHYNELKFTYSRFNSLTNLLMNSIVCIRCVIRRFELSNSIIETVRYALYIKQPDYINDGNQATSEFILNTNKILTASNIHLIYVYYSPTLIFDKNEFKCLANVFIVSDTIGPTQFNIFEVNRQCIFTSNVGNGNQILPSTYQFSENSMVSGDPSINGTLIGLFSFYTHEFGYPMTLTNFDTKTISVKNNYLLQTTRSLNFVFTFVIEDIENSYPCVKSDYIFIERFSLRNKLAVVERMKAHVAILDPSGIILQIFNTNNTEATGCLIYDPNALYGDSLRFLIGAIAILGFTLAVFFLAFCGGCQFATSTRNSYVEPSKLALERKRLLQKSQ
jgi:hypothetical protein